jgi:glycosyltransferase involved in cell wall biosynthesis
MDVLVAHNFYQQAGGEDQAMAAEVAVLKAHGHNVIQYRIHNNSINAMHRLGAASRTIWNGQTFHELRQLLQIHRPQIAHFHNTFPLISPAGYYAAQAENIPVVQTVHNFRLLCPNALLFRAGEVCEDCVAKTIPWPGVLHKCYRDSFAATSAVAAMLGAHRAMGTWRSAVDVYIALTEFSRIKLIEGGLPAGKIVLKSNFVHPDPGPGSGLGRYAIFVGRLSAEKGLDTLLNAWRRLAGKLPLKIIGDGPMATTVKEAAAKDTAVQWLGAKPLDAVYDAIGEATTLVLPSQCYENFPRVIVEAFAKGTPVLASSHGAPAMIVNNGHTGLLFRPGDPVDLAGKVESILADPIRLSHMRQAAREEFVRHFTAEANHKTLMAIYEKALGGRGRTSSPNSRAPSTSCIV